MLKQACLVFVLSLFALTATAAVSPEDVFWNSVSKTDVVEEYRLYLEQFPKGRYVPEARLRIEKLYEIDRLREESQRQKEIQLREESTKRREQNLMNSFVGLDFVTDSGNGCVRLRSVNINRGWRTTLQIGQCITHCAKVSAQEKINYNTLAYQRVFNIDDIYDQCFRDKGEQISFKLSGGEYRTLIRSHD